MDLKVPNKPYTNREWMKKGKTPYVELKDGERIMLPKKMKKYSKKALKTIGLKKETTFYKYYHDFYDLPDSDNCPGEELYGLKEILEDYKDPFWGEKYPGIEKKYLQFTSIEGEGSYFYDKQTDAVYDVDWNQMDDFMQGKLKPWFNSFYDFLEWYYSEADE